MPLPRKMQEKTRKPQSLSKSAPVPQKIDLLTFWGGGGGGDLKSAVKIRKR